MLPPVNSFVERWKTQWPMKSQNMNGQQNRPNRVRKAVFSIPFPSRKRSAPRPIARDKNEIVWTHSQMKMKMKMKRRLSWVMAIKSPVQFGWYSSCTQIGKPKDLISSSSSTSSLVSPDLLFLLLSLHSLTFKQIVSFPFLSFPFPAIFSPSNSRS